MKCVARRAVEFLRRIGARTSHQVAGAVLVAALGLAGCNGQIGEYLPLSEIVRNGFVGDEGEVEELRGRELRLWGFVDQGNLYGDADAKRVLGEWWSGDGPDADTWRFNLKAKSSDPVGRSFAVLVPNDEGRECRLQRFATDARARRATKVFVTGRLFTFHAPTQTLDLTGVYLRLSSSQDIRFNPPSGE